MLDSSAKPFDNYPATSSDVLVKYTYYGDADLNGLINGADYQLIDTGFGSHATDWAHGDFNYDGVVNGSDYALIDNTFNQLSARGLATTPLAVQPNAVPGVSESRATPFNAGTTIDGNGNELITALFDSTDPVWLKPRGRRQSKLT